MNSSKIQHPKPKTYNEVVYLRAMLRFPNAKINLGLHVCRKRDDGFHNIETIFYPLQLCDALEILPSGKEESSLELYGTSLPPGGENLCMKAVNLLKQHYDFPAVDMHLIKNIPAGAGLGGGSSDAAQTLLILNELFSLHISSADLETLASELGSDCAFFIRNKPLFASGRGNIFSPVELDLSNKYIRIEKPNIHISTPEAYSLITPIPDRPSLRNIIQKPITEWKDLLVNDFEKPIFEKHPTIRSLRDKMYEEGAVYAAMSGSGSAVFGIFD